MSITIVANKDTRTNKPYVHIKSLAPEGSVLITYHTTNPHNSKCKPVPRPTLYIYYVDAFCSVQYNTKKNRISNKRNFANNNKKNIQREIYFRGGGLHSWNGSASYTNKHSVTTNICHRIGAVTVQYYRVDQGRDSCCSDSQNKSLITRKTNDGMNEWQDWID